MFQTAFATSVILLLVSIGLFPAHVQKKQNVYSGDDPYGLKVMGMPKAKHKYLITDLPARHRSPGGLQLLRTRRVLPERKSAGRRYHRGHGPFSS